MKSLPQHDLRQEPAADLTGVTPAIERCLLALSSGYMIRTPKGYARVGADGKPAGEVFSLKTIDALLDRRWGRRLFQIGSLDHRKELWLSGEGAHAVRTLRRRAS